jgi:hypothetical protein
MGASREYRRLPANRPPSTDTESLALLALPKPLFSSGIKVHQEGEIKMGQPGSVWRILIPEEYRKLARK